MIETKITVDRETIIKGYKKAYSLRVLRDGASFYNLRAFFVFLAVAAVDAFLGASELIGAHLCVITALAIGASFYHYFDWLKKVEISAADYDLDVILDDEGVTFKPDGRRIEWDEYAYFKEYEDYLEITNKSGDISFLPKRDEYVRAIIFTKSKIENHANN